VRPVTGIHVLLTLHPTAWVTMPFNFKTEGGQDFYNVLVSNLIQYEQQEKMRPLKKT
jgi:hypothetical protein